LLRLVDKQPIREISFEKYIESEQRVRRAAWVATLLPLAVFLTLIYLTVRENSKLQDARRQTDCLARQIAEKQQTLDRMKRDVNYYASQVTPSVDIIFANEMQRSKALELAEQFKRAGFEAKVDDEPQGASVKHVYVRFFFDEDEKLACKLQELARPVHVNATIQGFLQVKDRNSLGYVRPKALEFWLGYSFVPTG